MLQPNDADIRREPCRMPVGPKRAPGLAVTALQLSASQTHSHPQVLLFHTWVSWSQCYFRTMNASRWGVLTVSNGAPIMAISYASISEAVKQLA